MIQHKINKLLSVIVDREYYELHGSNDIFINLVVWSFVDKRKYLSMLLSNSISVVIMLKSLISIYVNRKIWMQFYKRCYVNNDMSGSKNHDV